MSEMDNIVRMPVRRSGGRIGNRAGAVSIRDDMKGEGRNVTSGIRDHICALLAEALLLLDEEREIIAGIHVNQAMEALQCCVSAPDLRPGQAAK